jgi:hypothetical protein
LMIAAECLFLPGLNDELSYRLSLNAAWLLGKDAAARRSVYNLMKAAYQLRSDIVHTGAPKADHLTSAKTKTLPEFSTKVEETMRQALKSAVSKAASQLAGRPLFDWTDMALGQDVDSLEAPDKQ